MVHLYNKRLVYTAHYKTNIASNGIGSAGPAKRWQGTQLESWPGAGRVVLVGEMHRML